MSTEKDKPQIIYAAEARIPSEKAHPYQIVQMCEALGKVGAAVTLAYPNRKSPQAYTTDDLWAHYKVARNFDAKKLHCIDWYPMAERLPGAIGRTWLWMAARLAAITYTLSLIGWLRDKPDSIIYVRHMATLRLLMAAYPKRRKQMFFEAHTYPKTGAGVRLRRMIGPQIGGFIVITEKLREMHAELGIEKDSILVAHDAIREGRFQIGGHRDAWRKKIGWPTDAFIVGYVGRFYAMGMTKGVDTIVHAMKHLYHPGDVPPVRLALVGGPGEFVEEFRAELRKAGIPDNVILYAGQVPPAEVPGYMRTFDVCVVPSPWNEFFAYYSSPMKLFEYMASGNPIVASDLPAIAEVIRDGENGILVPPGDPKAMATAIKSLRDDPIKMSMLASQALVDVHAHYTWEARAEQIMAFIKRSMERGKAPEDIFSQGGGSGRRSS